jgi:hypothetical protein
MLEKSGFLIDATVAGSDDVLTLSNFSLNSNDDAAAPDAPQFSVMVPAITLTQLPDGTVSISDPQSLSIEVRDNKGDAPSMSAQFSTRAVDSSHIASGTPDKITYAQSAAEYEVELTSVSTPKGAANDFKNDFETTGLISITDWQSSLTHDQSDSDGIIRADQSLTAAAIAMSATFNDQASGDGMTFDFKVNDVKMNGGSSIPKGINIADPAALTHNDFSQKSAGSIGAANMSMVGSSDGKPFQADASAGSANWKSSFSADGIAASGSEQMVNLSVVGGGIPVPVNLSAANISMDLTMPIQAREETQESALKIAFSGLALPDALWMMADPLGAMPHDPIDFELDLGGRGILSQGLFDVIDAVEGADLAGSMPFTPETVTLNRLFVSALGAEINGSGALAFTGAPSTATGGVSMPSGELDLDLKGVNALVASLEKVGLLPAEQAMAARMMMAMLATPVGDDHLQSKIELTDDGHIFANGQQLQ